jgi:hypothetical protein
MVDAGRRAHEPVLRLGDHQGAALPHDPLRLAEDDLDLTRVALVAGELDHLARAGWPTDSLTFVLADDTSVTVRP